MDITISPTQHATNNPEKGGSPGAFSIDALHIVLFIIVFVCVILIIIFFFRIQLLRRQLMAPFEVRRQWWRFFRKDEATQVTDREIIEETKCLIGQVLEDGSKKDEKEEMSKDFKNDQAMPTQINPLEDKGSRSSSTSSNPDGSRTPDSQTHHSPIEVPIEIPARKQPTVVPVTNNFYIGYVPEAQLSPNPSAVVFMSKPSRMESIGRHEGRTYKQKTEEQSEIKTASASATIQDPYNSLPEKLCEKVQRSISEDTKELLTKD